MALPIAKKIPKEFELKNYNGCASWGAKEWYQALVIRRELFYCAQYDDQHWRQCGIDPKAAILSLMKHLLSIERDGEDEFMKPDWMPVSDQLIEDFFLGALLVREDKNYALLFERILKRRLWHSAFNEDSSKGGEVDWNAPAWHFHKKYFPNVDEQSETNKLAQFCVAVDLRASDELIRFQFDQWLRSTRQAAGIPSVANLGQNKLLDWHSDRLLPYLDLRAWAQINSCRISASDYLDVLFPAGERGDERAIRGIDKKAMEMVSADMIFALQCEAYRAGFDGGGVLTL